MRNNPVLFVMSFLAGINGVLAVGTLQEVVSVAVFTWIVLISAGLQAAVQFWVKGVVTPLANPRDANGNALVPAPELYRSPNVE